MVGVGEVSEVVVLHIPKALGRETDALTTHLSNNGLHNNFVGRNAKVLQHSSDLVYNLLSLLLGFLMVVILVFEVAGDDLLNDLLYLAGVKSASI